MMFRFHVNQYLSRRAADWRERGFTETPRRFRGAQCALQILGRRRPRRLQELGGGRRPAQSAGRAGRASTSASCCANCCAALDMMVMLENRLDALVRLHTPLPPAKIGGANDPLGGRNNLRPESYYGPNAGLTEVLIPAGYVTTVYDPVFALSPDGTRYVSVPSDTPTTLPPPGLPFSLVFRAEPGKEDVVLQIAAAYEAASKRRIPPPAFGPLRPEPPPRLKRPW